ncbi:MAG: helix-turn-helix domain-containing protein [Burkholderiaceae bacterium]|nr:helix-turn-helix domain-containing protein [Burkholderiaceae bacterium]
MQALTQHSASTRRAATDAQQFPPLELVNRPTVPTPQAAHYLNRRPQTMREWACLENGPLRPIRINGRLAWPVASIRALLGVAA